MTSLINKRFWRKIKYNMQEAGIGSQAVPPEVPFLNHLQQEFQALQKALGRSSHSVLHNFAVESRNLHGSLREVFSDTAGEGGAGMNANQQALLHGLSLTTCPGPLPLVENQATELSQVFSLFSSAISQQVEAEIQQLIDLVKRREVSTQELHHYELKLYKLGGGSGGGSGVQQQQPLSTTHLGTGVEGLPPDAEPLTAAVPSAVATTSVSDASSGGSGGGGGAGVPLDAKLLQTRAKLDASRRANQALVIECNNRMAGLNALLNQRIAPLIECLMRAEAAWLFDAGSAILSQVLPQGATGAAATTTKPTIRGELENLQRLLASGLGPGGIPPAVAAAGIGAQPQTTQQHQPQPSQQPPVAMTPQELEAFHQKSFSQQEEELQHLKDQQAHERATGGGGIAAAAALLGTGHVDTGKGAHHLHGTSLGQPPQSQQQGEGSGGAGVPPHYWASRTEPGAGGVIQHSLQHGGDTQQQQQQQSSTLIGGDSGGSVVTAIPSSLVQSSPARPEPLPRGKGQQHHHQHIRTASIGGLEALPFNLNPPSEIITGNQDASPHVTLCRVVADLSAPPDPSSSSLLVKKGFSLKQGELVLAQGTEARWKKVARDRDARMSGELADSPKNEEDEEGKVLRIFGTFGPAFCPQSALSPVFGVLESVPFRIRALGTEGQQQQPPKPGIPDDDAITRGGGVLRMLAWAVGKVDPKVQPGSSPTATAAEGAQPSQPSAAVSTSPSVLTWNGREILEGLGLHVRSATDNTLDLASSSLLPCDAGDELHVLDTSAVSAQRHYEKLRSLETEEGDDGAAITKPAQEASATSLQQFLLCRRRIDGRLGFMPVENVRLGSSPVQLEATEAAMVTPKSTRSRGAGKEGEDHQPSQSSVGFVPAEPAINYATPSNETSGQSPAASLLEGTTTTAAGGAHYVQHESTGLAILHHIKEDKQQAAAAASHHAHPGVPTLQFTQAQ